MCGRGSERGGIAEVDNKMGLLKKKVVGVEGMKMTMLGE